MPILIEKPSSLKMIFHQRVHKVEANLCKVAEAEHKEPHQICKEVHQVHKVEANLYKVSHAVSYASTMKKDALCNE